MEQKPPCYSGVNISQASLDHVWRYFALHAAQRFSVFNFYVVLIDFCSAGLGATLQGTSRFAVLGIILGVLISLISFVFWKFDQRGSMLIKHSEGLLQALESRTVGDAAAVFTNEFTVSQRLASRCNPLGIWSFGRSLRLIFLVMGLFGMGGASLSAFKFAGVLVWDIPDRPSDTASSIQSTTVRPAAALKAKSKPAPPQ